MNEVIDAIKYLYQQGIIDDTQFQNYYNMCKDPNINYNIIKAKLKEIYDNYKSGNKYDIDIIEVDDGDKRTGVIPINMVLNNLNDDNNPVIRDNLNEYEEIGQGESLGKQKTFSAHPGIHFGEDNGFMTLILVIFLAGISSGIVFMIILNFFAK